MYVKGICTMNPIFLVFLIVSIAAAVIFIARRTKKTDEKALLLKVIASISFIALGIVGYLCADGPKITTLVILGQVFGLCGDAFLDMRYVYNQHEKMHTLAGFVAFLACHVCFFIFMLVEYGFSKLGIIIAVVFMILILLGLVLLQKPMKMELGAYKTIVAIYVGGFAFVFGYSLGQNIQIGFRNERLVFFIGYVLFALSDIVLSQMYFVEGKNTKAAIVINHGLYYAAQILIASSMIFI